MGNPKRGAPRRQREHAPFADAAADEVYVFITGTHGCGRFEGVDTAGRTLRLKIKGSLYKRAFVNRGSVCLACGRSELAGGTYDIVWVYTAEEVKVLKRYEEVAQGFDSTGAIFRGEGVGAGGEGGGGGEEEEDTVVFEDI